MALGRKPKQDTEQWLSVDASMTGTLTFNEPVNLRINGSFEGYLETKGNLSIGPEAQVKAEIRGEGIMVAGYLEGNITASKAVELQNSARVYGDITTPRISIQEGAVLNGRLQVEDTQPRPYLNVEELARYLEVETAAVVQWAQEGRLPAEKYEDSWRFQRGKIEQWLVKAKINQGVNRL
jgi:excisionase family DNA binding protein